MPRPMLKVRSISSCGTLPSCRRCSNNGGTGQEPEINRGRSPAGQHARQILGDAAAGNVRQRGNALRVDQLLQRRPVALVRAHQLVAHFVLDLVDVVFGRVVGHFEQQLAGQRVSVGVQAVRSQAENDVADLHILAGDNPVAFHHAHDKSRQIVLAIGIEAGHLGRLAADQGAAVVLAGVGDAFHHFLGDRRLQLSRRQIVHKEQRRGALHGDVVDAVVHQVGAHGGMQAHLEGNLELRPHPIHARDQHRIHVLGFVHREQAAKAANFAEHAAGKGLVRQILDALLGAVGAVDIHTGVGVGDR